MAPASDDDSSGLLLAMPYDEIERRFAVLNHCQNPVHQLALELAADLIDVCGGGNGDLLLLVAAGDEDVVDLNLLAGGRWRE